MFHWQNQMQSVILRITKKLNCGRIFQHSPFYILFTFFTHCIPEDLEFEDLECIWVHLSAPECTTRTFGQDLSRCASGMVYQKDQKADAETGWHHGGLVPWIGWYRLDHGVMNGDPRLSVALYYELIISNYLIMSVLMVINIMIDILNYDN